MRKLLSAREAFENNEWLGGLVGADSFLPMRTLETYRTVTGGRQQSPQEPVSELWILAGRRSGKTVTIAALACYLAACVDWRHVLTRGERGTVVILAGTVVQARSMMNVVQAVFTDNPRFAKLVDSISGDTISLVNRVDICIRAASYRSIRGLTCVAVICEEISMWQSDELGSRNPDKAILTAVRPSLATTRGPLICIGSPYGKSGEAWKTFKRHFGQQGAADIIVANGPTKLFNPTILQSTVDRAYGEDPIEAASEWGGEFRNAKDAYVAIEVVEACVERGVTQKSWVPGRQFLAHVDVSGGGDDSFAIAVGHIEDEKGVLDCVLERRPPLSPEGTIAEFCDTLKSYRIHRIVGDAYSGEFVRELFRKNGIDYKINDELSDKKTCTSQYFASFLPILNSKRCELLDNKRLVQQLAALERRPSRVGARDVIGHPAGGHDDVACVVAGLMSRLLGKRGPIATALEVHHRNDLKMFTGSSVG